jgi:hypothetical protein
LSAAAVLGVAEFLSVIEDHPNSMLHLSIEPLFYTVLLIASFAVTSLFFAVYAWLVQKRQAKVMLTIDSKPIADLFPMTKIMFANISGFTAWCSVREPCLVLQLLEVFFSQPDEIPQEKLDTPAQHYQEMTS